MEQNSRWVNESKSLNFCYLEIPPSRFNVRKKSDLSSSADTSDGEPQTTVLGPLILIMLMNGKSKIHSGACAIFVGDVELLSKTVGVKISKRNCAVTIILHFN